MEIVLTGVQPYDGRYQMYFGDELTTREWGWIKRLSGYLPMTIEEAAVGGDPEFGCALAVIALRRSGKIATADVPDVFERLIDAPFGSSLTISFAEETAEEDDVGPPALSSNGSDSTSGTGSRTSSETSPPSRAGSGTPGLGSSVFDQPTSVT